MTDQITASDKAYRAILQAILENKFPKGEFLSQRKLAALAETSIISVREALKRLEHEHLLESIPKWGVRIPIETRERIISLYGIREALEVMVAYLLAKTISDSDARKLYQKAEECDLMHLDNTCSIDDIAKNHRALHLWMAKTTGNEVIKKELERLGLRSLLYQSRKLIGENSTDIWERWHRWLAEEIISRDIVRAQEAMHRHIQHGLHHDLVMFDQGKLQ
ncbi:hypothetical protein CSA56_07915 [candidate division KSB3 bacterium]|uniref:HTH gntR-type domain-containing protein n=1 Tax=candidate division KSB3 bacterium TaxID=2044937 RepID=A0A2G6KF51_9BACT|nr:MAG: hypothetical protein CSA56_07915 [candidate division KSB3 bacterium]